MLSQSDVEQASTVNSKNKKFSYRIVTYESEPFLISSGIDTSSSLRRNDYEDECKNGIKCLYLNENFYFDTNSGKNEEISKKNLIKLIETYSYAKPNDFFNGKYTKRCCTGYIVNLLKSLAVDLNFNIDLYILPERKFGRLNETTGVWSGAMNHIVNNITDIIAGPFSLNEERARYIDFSSVFLYSGYSLLIKREKTNTYDLFMFMKPFSYTNWLLIIFVALCSSLSLSLLEFNSPFGLNPMGRQRARNYTLGSAISMVMSLMFMHTMPAKSPKSWAGKWTQNFIAAFALYFIATYTAQMASVLSSGHHNKNFKSFNDNDLLGLKRGFSKDNSIEIFMCKKNAKAIYSDHCKNAIALPSHIEGLKAVNNRSIDVYMGDYEVMNYLQYLQPECDLHITGKQFAVTGYALGMSKTMNKTIKDGINDRLLDYYETGYLDELYSKWFSKRYKCNTKSKEDKIRIDFNQYKGVYAYLGIGFIAAVLVLFVETALYKWTIPWLRSKPRKSQWKDFKLMFISQRIYRIVHSEEVFCASQSAKEFFDVFKKGDFEAIFQKSFRKKQLQTMEENRLRKRPKLWALIEASTEREAENQVNNIATKHVAKARAQKLGDKLFNFDTLSLLSFKRKKSKELSSQDDASTIQAKAHYDDSLTVARSTIRTTESLTNLNDSIIFDFNKDDLSDFTDIATPALILPESNNLDDSDASPRNNRKLTNFDKMKVIYLDINNPIDHTDSQNDTPTPKTSKSFKTFFKSDKEKKYKHLIEHIGELNNQLDKLRMEKQRLEAKLKTQTILDNK